ncbi:MAG: DUF3492 domain-containing protein, partial [Candidatus Electrothrix sp. AW5]|nr:DUF3492 domain-containing protein [Candidatus Electrothrix gigas]
TELHQKPSVITEHGIYMQERDMDLSVASWLKEDYMREMWRDLGGNIQLLKKRSGPEAGITEHAAKGGIDKIRFFRQQALFSGCLGCKYRHLPVVSLEIRADRRIQIGCPDHPICQSEGKE